MDISNYFNIPNSEQLFCTIIGYGPFREILGVNVHDQAMQTLYEIVFVVPFYFRCPTTWQGANFSIDPAKDYWDLWSLRFAEVVSKQQYTENYHLFVLDPISSVGNPKPQAIQILASRALIHKVD